MTRHRTTHLAAFIAACGTALGGVACSDSDDGGMDTGPRDGGAADMGMNPDSGTADGGGTGDVGTSLLPTDFFPAPGPAFDSTSNAPGSVLLSVSGEDLAQFGYTYNANPGPDDLVFVDGWSLRFDHIYVVIQRIRLNVMGADPSMRDALGALVAETTGPWLVDLVKTGPVTGAGGAPETAHPIHVFTQRDDGNPFDTTVRYAFSFETGGATSDIKNVNLIAADRSAAEAMVENGWSIYFVGTATYDGRAASGAVDPTFVDYPASVSVRLGFGIPSEYINCHNPELGEDPEDPSFWGVQPSGTGAIRAQATFHTDHTFWDQLEVEGTPMHFDPIAARASNFGMAGEHVVTMADLMGVNPSALADQAGDPVLDRGDQTSGYTPNSPPPSYSLNGVSAADVPDFRAFIAYVTRGFGHLNADGECFVAPAGPFKF